MIFKKFLRSALLAAVATGLFACSNGGDVNTTDVTTGDASISVLELSVAERSKDSLKIEADGAESVESYVVYYSSDSTITTENYTGLQDVIKTSVKSQPFDINALEPNTTYKIIVEGLDSDGKVVALGETVLSTVLDTGEALLSLDGIQLPEGQEFSVTTSRASSPVKLENGIKQINVAAADNEIVGITDESGTPYLLGRKLTGESNVEINLASTAEVFVLLRSRFFQLEVSDDALLSSRIRSHQDFSKLMQKLAESMKTSPCPLKSGCSPFAAYIADRIASEINLVGIVQAEVQ